MSLISLLPACPKQLFLVSHSKENAGNAQVEPHAHIIAWKYYWHKVKHMNPASLNNAVAKMSTEVTFTGQLELTEDNS